MPQPFRQGDRIIGRLSDFWKSRLNESQQSQARRVIRRLRRTSSTRQGSASGQVVLQGRRTLLETEFGRVRLAGGSWKRAAGADDTVGETICGAVAKGLLNPSGSTGGEGDSGGDGSSSGGAGESSGSGEGSGEGESGSGNGSESGESGGSGGSGDDGGNSGSGDGSGEGEGNGDDDSSGEESGGGEDDSEGDDGDKGDSKESKDNKTKDDEENSLQYLKRRLHEIHGWLSSGEAEIQDSVSNVAFKMGARMLAAGIPVRGILHALTINWTETSRQQAGIKTYDPREFGSVANRHELFPYVLALVKANVPVYLCGPTQAGKSYVVEEVADFLGIPFGITPMTQGASASWLLGTWTPEGLVKAAFPEIYRSENSGGIHVYDEMDAADPNLLIVLNNSISNSSLMNPRTGELLLKHVWFRAVGTGNTWMTGATADYAGRLRGDRATAERFRMGRIAFGYDETLQDNIADAAYQAAMEEFGDGDSNGDDSTRSVEEIRAELAQLQQKLDGLNA